jgi:hypothetical protein
MDESSAEETHTDIVSQTLLTDADASPLTDLFMISGELGVKNQPKPLSCRSTPRYLGSNDLFQSISRPFGK